MSERTERKMGRKKGGTEIERNKNRERSVIKFQRKWMKDEGEK